jgi:hypothetical protein
VLVQLKTARSTKFCNSRMLPGPPACSEVSLTAQLGAINLWVDKTTL